MSAREPVPVQTETPQPTSTPTPTATPTHEPTPEPSSTPSSEPDPEPNSSPTGGGSSPSPSQSSSAPREPRERDRNPTHRDRPDRDPNDEPLVWWDLRPSFGGTYTTASLKSLKEQLIERDAPRRVMRELFAPFIIRGPAQFSDTWGAVRHAHGNELRPHLGQDVFCRAGDAVLAAEPGTVEFATDRLGGTIVRLHRNDGGYWYYAHLSGYAEGLGSGDRVEAGDVIGYCGNTGNASGTSPHVHFGSYPGPENPMDDLIGWLERAENKAARTLRRLTPGKEAQVGLTINLLAIERCPKEVAIEEEEPLDVLLTAS